MGNCKVKEEKDHDPVNHPSHYTAHPSGVECITVTEHMNFNVGNAVKYLWRADHKNGIEDLEKARWYIDREIQRLKFEKRNTFSLEETSEVKDACIKPQKNWIGSRATQCPFCNSEDFGKYDSIYSRCAKCKCLYPTYETRELKPGEFV